MYDPEYHRAYREENKEKIRAYKAAWHARNKDRIAANRPTDQASRAAAVERVRAWTAANADRRKEYVKRYTAENAEKIKEAARARYHANKEEKLAAAKAYREANPEKVAASIEKWHAANAGHIKEWRKAYYVKHSDAIKARVRQWAQRNAHNEAVKASRSARGKAWRTAHPEKHNAKAAYRRAAKIHRTPKWLTPDDRWMIEEIYHLAQLRSQVTGVEWHVDHVIPLLGKTVSGLHVPGNLRVIVGVENLRKGCRFEGEIS